MSERLNSVANVIYREVISITVLEPWASYFALMHVQPHAHICTKPVHLKIKI